MNSRPASQLEVTVGSTSLTIVEDTEQILNVFQIYYFDTPYDPVTQLHDIALLEVLIMKIIYINTKCKLLNFFLQIVVVVQLYFAF